jgi:chromosome segregation protein
MRLTTLRGSAESATSTLAAIRTGVERQQRALEAADVRRAEAEEALEGLNPQLVPEQGSAEHSVAYDRAQRAATEAENRVASTRERLHGTEREIEALTAQAAALGRALDIRNGARDLIARGGEGIRGVVGDAIQVQPGFETAIAAALGQLAEGVLVGGAADGFAVADEARGADLGIVDIVIAEPDATPVHPPAASGLVPAREIVTAPLGILGLLAHVFIADDLDAARRAGTTLVDSASSLTIVTRTGEVVTAYSVRAGTGASRSRLELAAERDTATDRLSEITVVADALREDLHDGTAALDSARRETKSSLERLRAHDAALAAHAEQVNRATVRAESAAAECERLTSTLQQMQASVAEAEADAARAQGQLDAALAAPRPILDASAREGVLAAVEDARETEMRARLDVETLRERVRAEEARVISLQSQREREHAAAVAAARRAAVREAQREIAQAVASRLPALLDSVDRSVSEARVELAAAEATRSAVSAELDEVRKHDASVRARIDALTERVHGLELQIHEKRLQLTSLLERVQSELGLSGDILVDEYGPQNAVPAEDDGDPVPYDRAAQRRRLQDAERKLGQLGKVNPLALEEYAALEQRHRFLTEQLDDLTRTRADLMTIIAELDERMVSIFVAAFEDTRTAFGEVFPILFPGGTGSISLTNPDDPLTTGIEVAVRPVGKKIERLSLLSGGERSLAAVALLTAIFKARPSPFYILDEVEAALDDANLGRLLGVFEQLRASSQLLIITHQKRTMEIADALYGVSMRQDGVSAVVGQRVASARSEKTPAPAP